MLTAGLVAAVATSVAGPLFGIATTIAADLKRSAARLSHAWMQTLVVLAAVLAAVLDALAPEALLARSLFAYTTLGAALGPLVLVRLSGKRIRPGSMLGAMWSAVHPVSVVSSAA